MQRIGVLTSGGDTPGMNAAVRSVFKVGSYLGCNVMGIYHGYEGLMNGNIQQLSNADVDDIIHKGGTILRTARSEVFRTDDGIKHAKRVLDAFGIQAVVCIGGDGTLNGAKRLSESGVPVIGIPGTIDNDLGYTDFTIGFDTAANSVAKEVHRIKDTMRSHDRVGVIEVMGRECGDIALFAGVAGGVDFILLPEQRSSGYQAACTQLISNKLKGKLTSIVLIAEGAGSAKDFCDYVKSNSDIDIKPIVLGYIQRGGTPSMFDRMMATRMGARAVELLDDGIINRALGWKKNDVHDMDLAEALQVPKKFNKQLYDINNITARF